MPLFAHALNHTLVSKSFTHPQKLDNCIYNVQLFLEWNIFYLNNKGWIIVNMRRNYIFSHTKNGPFVEIGCLCDGIKNSIIYWLINFIIYGESISIPTNNYLWQYSNGLTIMYISSAFNSVSYSALDCLFQIALLLPLVVRHQTPMTVIIAVSAHEMTASFPGDLFSFDCDALRDSTRACTLCKHKKHKNNVSQWSVVSMQTQFQ